MHLEILSTKQLELLPVLKKFPEYYLAGGTALALQIGHRKSIDFDLFTPEPVNLNSIKRKLEGLSIERTLVNTVEELTIIINTTKLTFLEYPFDVNVEMNNQLGISLPSPLTIAAMKAYTIGRRAKWKDYVDIYFLVREYKISMICDKAESIFGTLFSQKNFLEQLCYYADVDKSEKVDFTHEFPTETDIKKSLCNKAVTQ